MIHIVFGNLDAWLLGTHQGGQPEAFAGIPERICIQIQPPILADGGV